MPLPASRPRLCFPDHVFEHVGTAQPPSGTQPYSLFFRPVPISAHFILSSSSALSPGTAPWYLVSLFCSSLSLYRVAGSSSAASPSPPRRPPSPAPSLALQAAALGTSPPAESPAQLLAVAGDPPPFRRVRMQNFKSPPTCFHVFEEAIRQRRPVDGDACPPATGCRDAELRILLGFASGLVLHYCPFQQRVVRQWNHDRCFSSSAVVTITSSPLLDPHVFYVAFADGTVSSFSFLDELDSLPSQSSQSTSSTHLSISSTSSVTIPSTSSVTIPSTSSITISSTSSVAIPSSSIEIPGSKSSDDSSTDTISSSVLALPRTSSVCWDVDASGAPADFSLYKSHSTSSLPAGSDDFPLTSTATSWRIAQSPRDAVSLVVFSPCGRMFAALAGAQLRLFDHGQHKLLATFHSYFGNLLALAWSPDSQFVVAGGDDDFVSVVSVRRLSLVARWQGHRAAVTGLDFDRWSSTDRCYRFASVGKDGLLLLWEFSSALADADSAPVAAFPSQQSKRLLLEVAFRHHPLSHIAFAQSLLLISCTTGQVEIFRRRSYSQEDRREN